MDLRGYRKLLAFLIYLGIVSIFTMSYVIPAENYLEWVTKGLISFVGANLFEHVRKS